MPALYRPSRKAKKIAKKKPVPGYGTGKSANEALTAMINPNPEVGANVLKHRSVVATV